MAHEESDFAILHDDLARRNELARSRMLANPALPKRVVQLLAE